MANTANLRRVSLHAACLPSICGDRGILGATPSVLAPLTKASYYAPVLSNLSTMEASTLTTFACIGKRVLSTSKVCYSRDYDASHSGSNVPSANLCQILPTLHVPVSFLDLVCPGSSEIASIRSDMPSVHWLVIWRFWVNGKSVPHVAQLFLSIPTAADMIGDGIGFLLLSWFCDSPFQGLRAPPIHGRMFARHV